MPQFPQWKRQLAAWTDAAAVRRAQVGAAVSDFATRAEHVTGAIPAGVVEVAERTRDGIGQIPRTIADEVRRRVNVLDLATKRDVEVQSKLGRSRVSFVLKEFLEAQRVHDEELLQSLRAEIQEELQCFAAAIDDDLFAPLAPAHANDEDDADGDEDGNGDDVGDLDLVDYREIEPMADDEIDLLDVADD
jgi:hypothetical protein